MIKVKAHNGDLLNNLAVKLAKESYRYNCPSNLSISEKFKMQHTTITWANVITYNQKATS